MAVMHLNYFSKRKKSQCNVTVLLPTDGVPQYKDGSTILSPGMRYQTLWLLHGGAGDDTDYLHFSNIVRYADIHRIAVVMPAGQCFYEGVDYDCVTEELPLVLRTLLPLSASREDNFIGGLSHGGDGAMRACMEYPERYAGALIMSAAGTDHHGECALRFDVYGLAQRNLEAGAPLPRMVFATGSGDSGFPIYLPIIEKLETMGLPVARHFVEGDGHSWDFWDNTLRTALDGLLPIRHDVIR